MAKLLVTSHGTTGDIIPFLRLSRALVRLGHSVMFTSTPNHRQRVLDWGLPFTPIGIEFGRDTLAIMLSETNLGPGARDKGLGGFARHVLKPFLESAYPAFLVLAREFDSIVGHGLALWARPAARLLGKPFARLHFTAVDFPSAYYLPDGTPAPSADKARSAWKTALLANRRFLVDPLRTVYEQLGIPAPDRIILEDPESTDLNLLAVDPAWTEPAPDWPASLVQAGFLHPERDELAELPKCVEDFVEASRGRPLLVIALGSAPNENSADFHAQFLPAARRHGFRVLIVEGWQGSTSIRDDDTLSVAYCSYDRIFPRADLVVHQGSTLTTADCVRAGVPQVVIPFGYYDNKDCALRVERLGCGTWIHPGNLSPATIEQKFDDLVSRLPAVKQQAQRLRARLIPDGNERCATAVNRLLKI